MMLVHKIAHNFDRAAKRYDTEAPVQGHIAKDLAAWAVIDLPPQSILDIGCGTGFASAAAAKKWPLAEISALDPAPAMLIEAQRKMPKLQIILGDAVHMEQPRSYDMIFSSMMLHWLPHPLAALTRWQTWLKPEGRFYAALLTEGSFCEWSELCARHHLRDGLWKMPPADFAEGLSSRREAKEYTATFPSAHDFLHHLKAIGAAAADPGHKPLTAGAMRHLLRAAPQPFTATYKALFIEINAVSGR